MPPIEHLTFNIARTIITILALQYIQLNEEKRGNVWVNIGLYNFTNSLLAMMCGNSTDRLSMGINNRSVVGLWSHNWLLGALLALYKTSSKQNIFKETVIDSRETSYKTDY